MNGLAFHDVSHAFDGRDVIRGVSLSLAAGQVACLLGPSGCGKTTLLRLAAGLESLRRGRILISGRVVADGSKSFNLAPERRRVGLMFQDYALFPHLTVYENITFGLAGGPLDRSAAVQNALEQSGLAALADSFPHMLSGGEQQRCALLRALAPGPDVLLLDEPFSGLDVTLRASMREQTLALLRQAGVATLIVTHDPEEAMFMADVLWVMNQGSIVQQGSPAEVYLRPQTAFVASLFGPVNQLQGRVKGRAIETLLGTFDAGPLAEGIAARILIRPEGLRLDANGDGMQATIVTARLLGRSTHVRIDLPGLAEPLQALVPGVFVAKRGEVVSVRADPACVFVFSADEHPATVAASP
jgi:iron(III) transport system ATP-binding protein